MKIAYGLAVKTAVFVAVVLPSTLRCQETISLFNGTELWYVEDGDLICESGPDSAYGRNLRLVVR